jgi:alpha-mannosidase
MLIPKVEARIRQYLEFLDGRKYERATSLALETAEVEGTHRLPPDGNWFPVDLPYSYGKEWTSAWFRARFSLPPQTAGREVFLRAVPGADSLVFLDGAPFGALNPLHEKLRLFATGETGRRVEVHLEAYAGHPYAGMHPLQPPSVILTLNKSISGYPIQFEAAELLLKNEPIYGLYYDTLVLYELSTQLDEDSLRKNRILLGLHAALMRVHLSSEGSTLAAQAAEARTRLAPLLEARNGSTAPRIFIVGHAHIDHAWLWPISETERKAARTFAAMARFSEEFPEFRFIQTQPAQLDAVRREYPAVFRAVKEAYERGQWEPNGGMWVEADCNIPSGESLVRQFLVGKRTTREMLGYEGDTLWLPDVFGYAAALPQILAGCEIEFFVTSKINWNDTSRFPYDTFFWRGIDGTGVRTHYITSRMNGYNGRVTAAALAGAWHHVQHKEVQDGVIFSIGEGDGGGGTMRSDLEAARRLSDLEGSPRTGWSRVSDALKSIFETAGELPVWQGELYLELHRGTYTTQARTKRSNRAMEYALRECELLYAGLRLLGDRAAYPAEELRDCWKRLLTNQFHDIIPGSSITRVYRDAEHSYGEIRRATERLTALARGILAARLQAPAGGLAVFNPLSWERAAPTVLPWSKELASPSEVVSPQDSSPVQVGKGLGGEPEAVAFLRAPSMGMSTYRRRAADRPAPSAFIVNGEEVETPFYRIRFDDRRRIQRLQDRESGREVVPEGEKLNRLVSAVDVPVLWDAWDIDSDWTTSMTDEDRLESAEVVSDGPVFLQLRNRYRICERSTLLQDVILYAAERRIDFRTRVDWRESHRLLKAAFPVEVLASQVRCEVQYGHVLRSTTANLPQDRARFEFCAHKWICVEESGFGAALLNDCKYGHDVRGSTMRLTLLRSPKAPDPEADMGTQDFTYSLLPYSGAFSVERVVRGAYGLNVPLAVFEGGAAGKATEGAAVGERSLFQVDCPEVIIEAVKPAEEDESRVVVRLYEAGGGARRALLSTAAPVSAAWETNMLERKPRACEMDGHGIRLSFRPFEIKTVLLAVKA